MLRVATPAGSDPHGKLATPYDGVRPIVQAAGERCSCAGAIATCRPDQDFPRITPVDFVSRPEFL
ncbi:hypothetical protein PSCLAVI8L_130299 [Pseudoclavibacter sp. 8L]|nr:hypothetical protein PSCLAVI8L_130299 [Pseudoclavibacter sp. 8L]